MSHVSPKAGQLCRRLSLGTSVPPPGAHAGAARLRLAFARVWELQEALSLMVNSVNYGKPNAIVINLIKLPILETSYRPFGGYTIGDGLWQSVYKSGCIC